MDKQKSLAALGLLLALALCNGTSGGGGAGLVDAQQHLFDGGESDLGIVGSMRYTTNVAPSAQFVGMSPTAGGGPNAEQAQQVRFRRQIEVPPNSPLAQQQLPGQQPGSASSSLFSLFSGGAQPDRAKSFPWLANSPAPNQPPSSSSNPLASLSSLSSFSSLMGGQNPLGGGQNGQNGPSSAMNVMQMMSQLTELIRSTQDNNARMLESTQRSAEGAGEQTLQAARSAQGGIQQALTEMGQGLQRLAANNPNLLPDIKNLYQTVSQRLSSASSSVAQTAQSAATPPTNNLPVLPTAQS